MPTSGSLNALLRILLGFVLLVWLAGVPALADAVIPNFWDPRERSAAPRVHGIERLRFLTTTDFPPFNHLDDQGRLVGFHIDLARAICRELEISDRCQIQALPWDELEPAVAAGEGEAILAGLAITGESRARLSFTRPYLKFPARFALPVSQASESPLLTQIRERRIGVLAGTAHERMLREYFPQVRPVTYDRAEWMHADLRDGRIAGIFADGMQLAFWLDSPASGNCCRLAGGPFLSDRHFGLGLAIAAPQSEGELIEALNFALREIHTKGTFGEIYLRYFPIGFY